MQDQIILANTKYPTGHHATGEYLMFSTGSQEYLTVALLHGN